MLFALMKILLCMVEFMGAEYMAFDPPEPMRMDDEEVLLALQAFQCII